MKLTENPSLLGIEYIASSDFISKEGRKGVRFILTEGLSSDQEQKLLGDYDNIEIKRGAATYKYAPELKYDVLYVFDDPEEEVAEEDILDMLDSEIKNVGIPPEVESNQGVDTELEKYSAINSAISMASSAILLYKDLASRFPEYSELFVNLAGEREVEIGKLTAIMDDSTKENMQEGLEQGEALSDIEQ